MRNNRCCLAGRIALCIGAVSLVFLLGSFRFLLILLSIVLVLIGFYCILFKR